MKHPEAIFIDRDGVKVMINKSDKKESDKIWSDKTPDGVELKKRGRPRKVIIDE